jgi:antitoxin ParD1/3/4
MGMALGGSMFQIRFSSCGGYQKLTESVRLNYMKKEENDALTSMSISVFASQKSYVETEAARGGYATPSEYMRELIRDDQKRKADERLEALLLEGVASGEPVPMTKKHWEAIRDEVRRYAGTRKARK